MAWRKVTVTAIRRETHTQIDQCINKNIHTLTQNLQQQQQANTPATVVYEVWLTIWKVIAYHMHIYAMAVCAL